MQQQYNARKRKKKHGLMTQLKFTCHYFISVEKHAGIMEEVRKTRAKENWEVEKEMSFSETKPRASTFPPLSRRLQWRARVYTLFRSQFIWESVTDLAISPRSTDIVSGS
jgi:hypothetical protein